MKAAIKIRFSGYKPNGTPKDWQSVPSMKKLRELVRAKGLDACRFEIDVTQDLIVCAFSEQQGRKLFRAFGGLSGVVVLEINGAVFDSTIASGRWECGKTPNVDFLTLQKVVVREDGADALSAEIK